VWRVELIDIIAIGGAGIDNTTYEIDGVYNMNTATITTSMSRHL